MVRRRRHAASAAGFTLVEILIALGVFAIGMIAVASLFPVAALLQKQTADEIVGGHAAQSAKAIVMAKGLTYDPPDPANGRPGPAGDLAQYYRLAGQTRNQVVPLNAISPYMLSQRFSAYDRSYPTGVINYAVNPPDNSNCDLFWVPFVQDLNGNPYASGQSWVMRVFLLKRDSGAVYDNRGNASNSANPGDPDYFPEVRSIGCSVVDDDTFRLSPGHGLEAGDKVMDNNGTDYTLVEVDGNDATVLGRILLSPARPSTIWYAPRGTNGSSSPTLSIVTVKIQPTDPTPNP